MWDGAPDTSLTITTIADISFAALRELFAAYGLDPVLLDAGNKDIPGSYWGPPEAGLIGHHLYVRPDTPVHSAFHEACHYICMDSHRRSTLNKDAGGDDIEENAVCYLQILLADLLPCYGRQRMLADMDAWGYSFRLGSAQAWFDNDADDARSWLLSYGLLEDNNKPTTRLR